LIDRWNYYELIQKGFVIPRRDNGRYEPIRTLEEINSRDKGGMIFSPRVGLHENVVVLDYENEYANLIIRHNLSYEINKGSKERGLPMGPVMLGMSEGKLEEKREEGEQQKYLEEYPASDPEQRTLSDFLN